MKSKDLKALNPVCKRSHSSLFQNKRKEKLQQLQVQQQQQQQQQKSPLVATTGKRISDGDNQILGLVTLDVQQQNSTAANHHVQVPLMGIPLQTLEDIP